LLDYSVRKSNVQNKFDLTVCRLLDNDDIR